MECNEARELLAEYADGGMSIEARRDIEDHLDHCYLCVEELKGIRELLDACRGALKHPAPRDRFEELRGELYPQVVPFAMFPRRGRHVVRNAVAAAISLLILIHGSDRFVNMARGVNYVMAAAVIPAPPAAEPGKAGMPLLLGLQQRASALEWLSAGLGYPEARRGQPEGATSGSPKGNGAPEPVSWLPGDNSRMVLAATSLGEGTRWGC